MVEKVEKRTPLKIEIDLEAYQVGEDGSSLFDHIMDLAARRLLEKLRADNKERAYPSLIGRVEAIRDEMIREAIGPDIEQAVESAAQPTDAFGNPKSDPVTLHETIVNIGTRMLTEKKRSDYGKDSRTVVESYIEEAVKRVIDKDLREALDAARAEVQAAVREKGAEVMAETITKMARP